MKQLTELFKTFKLDEYTREHDVSDETEKLLSDNGLTLEIYQDTNYIDETDAYNCEHIYEEDVNLGADLLVYYFNNKVIYYTIWLFEDVSANFGMSNTVHTSTHDAIRQLNKADSKQCKFMEE